MSFRDRFRRAIEELSHGEPEPKSIDRRPERFFRSAGVESPDIHEADKQQLDDYWELFETVPIIREPIRTFATEVVADGVRVEADSESDSEELEEWLEEAAILNGEPGRNFNLLLKDLIIQREVRGTALVEKVGVKGEEDILWGFKPIPVTSVKEYTRPNQSVLLSPNDTDFEGVILTEDGEAAAYVQFDDNLSRFSDKDPVPFTRDQIIKIVRDADVSDVFGNSRLQAVEDRVNSLEDKLDNNDKAIESLAWKFWLFQFGTPDDPWHPDDIDSFMKNHTSNQFEPGMKQAVQGDVGIKTISGETADIESFLEFDVNWIMSAMPMPKFALGGFEENVNQFVSRSQETRVTQQIKEARRELEDEFTPAVREKAEELGISSNSVRLKIGPEEEPETDFTRPPASSEQDNGPTTEDEGSIWTVDDDIASLSHAQPAPNSIQESELEQIAFEALSSVRDGVLNRLEGELPRLMKNASDGDIQIRTSDVGRIVDFQTTSAIRRTRPAQTSVDVFRDSVKETLDELSNSQVESNSTFGFDDRQMVRSFAQDFGDTVELAAEQMAGTIRIQGKSSLQRGEEPSKLSERVLKKFSDSNLQTRAELIAQMELRNASETTRLREFEKSENVIGVKAVNSCSPSTTPLCRDLAGCGEDEPVIVKFGEGDIGEQLEEHIDESKLFAGFNPIPLTPPFHHGCMTTFAPVFEGEEELEESEIVVADD